MPLNPTQLQTQLQALFSAPPQTEGGCAQQWADAMGIYAAGIVPPSTSVMAAKGAMVGALSGMSSPGAAVPIFEAAFSAFAASVGTGMAPAFVATPPPGPVGFAALAPLFPSSHSAAATAFTTRIDTWMRTGLATPPVGPVVPWS